eukprot:519319_1
MDLETYTTILTKRDANALEIPNDIGISNGLNRANIAFRKDLIRGKIIWYNDQKKDWHAYIKNNHLLYSVFKAPVQHPFSRIKRILLFISSLSVAVFFSIILSVDNNSTENGGEFSPGAELIYLQIMFSMFSGLIKFVITKVLKFIAICACCQTNAWANQGRCFVECIGTFFMIIWTIFMILWAWLFITLADKRHDFALSFILTMIWSWIWSLVILSIRFKMGYKSEKQNKKNKLGKLKVNFIDYEKYIKGNDIDITELKLKIPLSSAANQVKLQYNPPQNTVVYKQVPQNMEIVIQQTVNNEPLSKGWRTAIAQDGTMYYQNDITKETQWNRPE